MNKVKGIAKRQIIRLFLYLFHDHERMHMKVADSKTIYGDVYRKLEKDVFSEIRSPWQRRNLRAITELVFWYVLTDNAYTDLVQAMMHKIGEVVKESKPPRYWHVNQYYRFRHKDPEKITEAKGGLEKILEEEFSEKLQKLLEQEVN